jgi:hypothetical protein
MSEATELLEQEDALRTRLSRARAEVGALVLAIRKACAMTARAQLEGYQVRHLELHGQPASIAQICLAVRVSERYLRRLLRGDVDHDCLTVARVLEFLESSTAPLPVRRPGRPQKTEAKCSSALFPPKKLL